MKKTFRIVGASLLCALVPAMVSCGGDDDEPNGPSATPGGINNGTPEVEGLYLTSINNIDINYDSNGRVSGFNDSYDKVTIDYSKGVINFSEDGEDIEMKVKFNGNGYISSLSESWEYRDEDEYAKGNGSASASYDKDGHLTKISSKSSETYRDEDGNGSYSGEETWTFSWQNGNLVSATYTASEKEDGVTYTENEEFTLKYGNEQNPFKQVSYGVYEKLLDISEWSIFGCAGLLGVGTSSLPESMSMTYSPNGSSTSTHNYTISFTKNSNGTLHTEQIGSESYTYGYKNLGVRSASDGQALSLKNFKLFRTHKDSKVRK